MKTKIILMIGLATLLAPAMQASQEQLARSVKDARVETMRTADQLKATLESLNVLTKKAKGDLRPAYDAFGVEVTKTRAAAATTRKQADWMAGDGRQYFNDWQNTVNSMANESLRKKAQKRLDGVQKNYTNIEAAMRQANDKFAALLSDLADIQKALATDITAGGVKAIRGTVKTANWDHQYVTRAIDTALSEMARMEKALSPEAQ